MLVCLAAGRFSIVSWPVYWAIDLFHSASRASSKPQVPEISNTPLDDVERPDYRFMLGTDFWGFGFAAYIVLSNSKQVELIRNPTGVSERVVYNGDVETINNLYQPKGNRYGIELGQSDLPVPLAWTLNLEYRQTGGKNFDRQGDETRTTDGAPSTIFAISLIPNFGGRIAPFTSTNGNNRQEFRSNFLGWYTLIPKKLNVGLSYALMIPFGSGRNSDLRFANSGSDESNILTLDGFEPAEDLPRKTKLSGYDIAVTLFTDIDFFIQPSGAGDVSADSSTLKESIFRITPSITFREFHETLFYNDAHDFKGELRYFALNMDFKSQLVLTQEKNFFLFFGWLPKIILLEEFKTITRSGWRAEANNEPLEATNSVQSKTPKILYDTFSIGLSYIFFEKLKLHFAWYPRGSADTGGGEKFDLSVFDFGVDYSF